MTQQHGGPPDSSDLRLDELEELVALPPGAVADDSQMAAAAAAVVGQQYEYAPTTQGAGESSPTTPSSRQREEPHLSVWSSHWFLQAPPVSGDAGESEGRGVVHGTMVSGWKVDLGTEWAEPPRFKPQRFIMEWLMAAFQPIPHLFLAAFWTCKGEGRPWRALDGFAVTKEHHAEHGAVERGHSSGLFYLPIAVIIFCIRFVPAALGVIYFAELREGSLLPLGLAYAVVQVLTINQPAAKIAFQAVAANRRLQSAFERRKNEFLTGWLIAALDVAIFEIRLASARTGLDLEAPLIFECNVLEMRQFLAPVLHAVDHPDKHGRRPKEELVQQLLDGAAEAGGGGSVDPEALAQLDSENLVRPCGSQGDWCVCSAKLLILRLLWYSCQRDGSYRTQGASGIRSNAFGGPVGAFAQLSMILMLTAAPHVVRLWEGPERHPEPMTRPQIAFCICTGAGFLVGSNLASQFTSSAVFDLARRRHSFIACRSLVAGSVRPLSLGIPSGSSAKYTATYARTQAVDGFDSNSLVQFPRIGTDPETVFVWSKVMRVMRFLGQHFFRRTEVLLVYILLLFGAVFAYLWYLQLSDAPVSGSVLELVYAVRAPRSPAQPTDIPSHSLHDIA